MNVIYSDIKYVVCLIVCMKLKHLERFAKLSEIGSRCWALDKVSFTDCCGNSIPLHVQHIKIKLIILSR